MVDLKDKAAKARGLAPAAMISKACPGAVFIVKDAHVVLPESRIDGASPRTLHPGRRVIIVQAQRLVSSLRPVTLLVVPCSTSARGPVGEWDFQLPADEGGFTDPNVVAYVSLVQPMLKSDLEKHCGDVSAQTLTEIQARLARNLGIVPVEEVALPPRVAAPEVVAGE